MAAFDAPCQVMADSSGSPNHPEALPKLCQDIVIPTMECSAMIVFNQKASELMTFWENEWVGLLEGQSCPLKSAPNS